MEKRTKKQGKPQKKKQKTGKRKMQGLEGQGTSHGAHVQGNHTSKTPRI